MQAIARGEMTELERFLLCNCVATYIELKGDEKMRYEEMIRRNEATEVANMEMTWADKIAHRSRTEGERQMLLRLAEHRFGPLAEGDRQRIEAIDSSEELERLGERLLDAGSLEEWGLNGGGGAGE